MIFISPPTRLSWKLLLPIVPLLIAGIGGIVSFQYFLARKAILKALDKEIRGFAQRMASQIDDQLQQRYRDLFTLAETPLIADYYRNIDFQLLAEAENYRQELENYLLNFSKRSTAYFRILYLDREGNEICRIERDKAGKPARASSPRPDYYSQPKKLAPGRWWTSTLSAESARGALYYAKPVHDESGELKGIMVLGYDAAGLAAVLGHVEIGKRGAAYVRAEHGRIIKTSDSDLTGVELLSAEHALSERPWSVVVEAPLEDFLGPLKKVRDASAAIAVLGASLLASILLLLVRSITRPIKALVEAARRIGRGNLSHRIKTSSHDELGLLSSAFNQMAADLESNLRLNGQLQGQLIQAEKLSAVGQLISSVAHELNNPLAAVSGYAQIALLEDCPNRMRQDLERVHGNVLRCRKVVDNLLFFVRQSRHEKTRINLNSAAQAALDLLEYRLTKTEDVAISLEADPALPDIIGDFQQIAQVLVNLINNACDAMAQTAGYPEGKSIKITTSVAEPWVAITMKDNGCGIPMDLRSKVFEPFFTTKEPGKGTGLGLSICRQIIADHGGKISFKTRTGAGTTFLINLPLATANELEKIDRPPEPLCLPPVPHKRILVVDDEPELAEVIARLLREDKDEVVAASRGEDALKLIAENDYDLVISDIEMEGTKGQDIFARLAGTLPDPVSRILFVTGDILNPKVLEFFDKTKANFLVKPFDLKDLQQAVRKLLARGIP